MAVMTMKPLYIFLKKKGKAAPAVWFGYKYLSIDNHQVIAYSSPVFRQKFALPSVSKTSAKREAAAHKDSQMV